MLRVNLEQLEVDFLSLRIFLERLLQDFLGLCIATIREINLGFGDRVHLIGIDVAQALAAEIACERIVTGVHDATAGRAEHRVGLDVGARNDAVFKLGSLASARGDESCDQRENAERAGADCPSRRIADELVQEGRLGRRRGFGRLDRRRRGLGFRRFGFGCFALRRLGFRSFGFGRLCLGRLGFGRLQEEESPRLAIMRRRGPARRLARTALCLRC